MIGSRQIRIIKLLCESQGYCTFSQLAQSLEVCVKTVRNDISAIQEYLSNIGGGKIVSKPNAGVRLEATAEQLEAIWGGKDFDEESGVHQLLYGLVRQLLKNKSISAQKFATAEFISRTTMDKTVDKAKAWFSRNRIECSNKRGKGIEIFYSELNYRLAHVDFYTTFKSLIGQAATRHSSCSSTIDPFEYGCMAQMLNGFNPEPVFHAIAETEAKLGFCFSHTAAITAALLASLCVIRSRQGFVVEEILPLCDCASDGFDREAAACLIDLLEKKYNIKLPTGEREFVVMLVSVCEMQALAEDSCEQRLKTQSPLLQEFTDKFVKLCSELAGVDFSRDEFFVEQIFLQLKTVIGRLRYGVSFRNPLMPQIKAKYPSIMAMAWAVGDLFSRELGLDLKENEAGLLALHIGGAMERGGCFPKACIVCDYGVGIAQILKEKLLRAVDCLNITSVISCRDIRNADTECDFFISTMPLKSAPQNKEVIVVSPLLLFEDVKRIRQLLKGLRNKRNRRKLLAKTAGKLIDRQLITSHADARTKEELLEYMCERLEATGYVTAGFKASVFAREQNASTEVGKGIALPHGSSEFVKKSIVSVARTKRPLAWFDSENRVDLVFLLAFDLHEAPGVKDEIVRFYKSFVTFLEDDSAVDELKNLQEPTAIYNMLTQWER